MEYDDEIIDITPKKYNTQPKSAYEAQPSTEEDEIVMNETAKNITKEQLLQVGTSNIKNIIHYINDVEIDSRIKKSMPKNNLHI